MQLSLDLFPNEMELINGFAELTAYEAILVKGKLFALIFAEVEAVKGVLKSKRVCNLKLLPRNDTPCPNLVWLYLEAAVFVAEKMCFLGKDPWQNSNDCPTQESSISCRVAPIEETVFLLGVTVNIAVDPYVSFLVSELFEKILNVVYLGVELQVWCYPLSV